MCLGSAGLHWASVGNPRAVRPGPPRTRAHAGQQQGSSGGGRRAQGPSGPGKAQMMSVGGLRRHKRQGARWASSLKLLLAPPPIPHVRTNLLLRALRARGPPG